MSFTVESKSQLAKLLATENIQIVHENIPTARFNLETRTLHCPIWKDMSGELYDLLMGHEVGHALFTPKEGWHDEITEEGRNFKGFLNVIEDSRIEKKIKRKYPGIKRSFHKAYSELMANDFFQIAGRNLDKMSFIDKLNLNTKIGIEFDFNEKERELYEEVLSCESWNDVVISAKKVYEYCKQEQQDKAETSDYSEFNFSYDNGEEEFESENDYDDYGNEYEKDEGSSEIPSSSSSEIDNDSEETGNDSDDGVGDHEPKDNFEPVCLTDENFRRNEYKLLDEKSREYLYVAFPKPIYENILTPYKVVHKHLSEFYSGQSFDNSKQLLQKFKEKNDKFISLMAKEFEMRKSANIFSKSKVSETGDIDINKIYKYKVEDNIFKKVTMLPKGKSHGLVLLLDRSGSMSDHMGSSIEQILVLTSFCRKVNIPFVVYGFGNFEAGRVYDYPEIMLQPCFEYKENQRMFDFDKLYLREYLSSTMKKSEFNNAFKNMVKLAHQYKSGGYFIPMNEGLSSTPLNQTLVTIAPLVKKFKKNNNLDIVNTVIVHDGDSDMMRDTFVLNQGKREDRKIAYSRSFNIFISDKENRIQIKLNHADNWRDDTEATKNAILEWYRQVTGSKIFGFFIVGNRATDIKKCLNSRFQENLESNKPLGYERVHELFLQLKETKFLESKNKGYDGFYFIPGGKKLEIEDDEIVINGNVTSSKLVNAFRKMSKNKHTNRILVTKFISGISC